MAVENWDESTFALYYWRHVDGVRIGGYDKAYFEYLGQGDHLVLFRERWAAITANLPIQTTDTVLVAGCGFGYLISAAREAGYLETYGLDNSPHVAAHPEDVDPGVTICEYDLRGPQLLNELRQATGYRRFDWIITEDLVACFTTAEVQGWQGAIEAVLNPGQTGANILHITTVERGLVRNNGLTWLTLPAWAAVIPSHNWMDAGTHDFIGAV